MDSVQRTVIKEGKGVDGDLILYVDIEGFEEPLDESGKKKGKSSKKSKN